MMINLKFISKTPKEAQENEILFLKKKITKNKIFKPLNNHIFSNKLFIEKKFLKKNLNNKTYIFVNCLKANSNLDYEKLGSKLYLYLKDNKIENSFINVQKNLLTGIQLEKTLHGAQLKSYDFSIYKSDKNKKTVVNLNVIGNDIKKTNLILLSRIKIKNFLIYENLYAINLNFKM